jgi:hypothetical protein
VVVVQEVEVVVIAQVEVAVIVQEVEEAEVVVIAQAEVVVVVQEVEVVVIVQEVEVALIAQVEVAQVWIVQAQVVQRLPVHHPTPTFYQIKHQVSDIPNILIPQRNPFRRRSCGAPPFHR